ncbi:MAG: cupin domain-containing protein [Chthoniobacter sp.]
MQIILAWRANHVLCVRAPIFIKARKWFEVLQTTMRSQTAVMTLGPGQSSGDQPEAHEGSDQVLLLVQGRLSALIGGKRSRLKAGDVVVIPPQVKTPVHQSGPGTGPSLSVSIRRRNTRQGRSG